MKKIKRLHDKLYLKENRYNKPKESFKEILKIIKKQKNLKNKNIEYLDVGCASGELIYFISKNLKNIRITGLDVMIDLLKKAKKYNPQSSFFQKNINSKKFIFKKKYDLITMTGVLSIFDNFETSLNNLKKMMNTNSILIIHGHFNPYPYDVLVKYTEKGKRNILQSGWNIFSISSLKKYCKDKKLSISVVPFLIKKHLFQNKKDLIRTWTIKYKNRNYFTNGLNLFLSKYFLIIKKK
tara:strand:+ start:38 stop:751 length:714 start_codon:yes stop_codon:yes gene_type:complete